MGVAGVPTILEYLTEHLSEGDVLGLNGRMINTSYGKKLARLAASKKAVLETDHTLAEDLWTGRPAAAASPIFIHEDIYAGESVPSKLKRIRSCMETVSAEAHFIASLPDIAVLQLCMDHTGKLLPVCEGNLSFGRSQSPSRTG